MSDWKIWNKKLKAAKDAWPKKLTDKQIAAAIESATGKQSDRGLVNAWLHGTREPYLSQFFALCAYLEVDPRYALGLDDKPPAQSPKNNGGRPTNVTRFPQQHPAIFGPEFHPSRRSSDHIGQQANKKRAARSKGRKSA